MPNLHLLTQTFSQAHHTSGTQQINGPEPPLTDELLNGEVFYTLREAQILIEMWHRHYNNIRPHSSLGYRPPAPKALIPLDWRPTIH